MPKAAFSVDYGFPEGELGLGSAELLVGPSAAAQRWRHEEFLPGFALVLGCVARTGLIAVPVALDDESFLAADGPEVFPPLELQLLLNQLHQMHIVLLVLHPASLVALLSFRQACHALLCY